MTHEAQRIAIAEACGWTLCHNTGGLPCGVPPGFIHEENSRQVPDYLNDLNAMYDAENVIIEMSDGMTMPDKWSEYCAWLSWRALPFHATAAQRAEAFLRTLKLWHP